MRLKNHLMQAWKRFSPFWEVFKMLPFPCTVLIVIFRFRAILGLLETQLVSDMSSLNSLGVTPATPPPSVCQQKQRPGRERLVAPSLSAHLCVKTHNEAPVESRRPAAGRVQSVCVPTRFTVAVWYQSGQPEWYNTSQNALLLFATPIHWSLSFCFHYQSIEKNTQQNNSYTQK